MSKQFSIYFSILVCNLLSTSVHAEELSYRRYATKTSYNSSIAIDALSDNQRDMESCVPTQVLGLFRHGTRFPGQADVRGAWNVINRLLASDKLTESHRILLQNLKTSLESFDFKDCKLLAPVGNQEHTEIGRRFSKKFYQVFANRSADEVAWLSSYKPRAIDSCVAFQTGLLGRDHRDRVEVRDDLLRFFDNCEHYMEKVVRNKTALAEVNAFQQLYYHEITERLSQKLPVDDASITPDEMKNIYTIAASELAVHGTTNWDVLFSEEDLTILEYATDIKNYWKKSYGYKINYEQACILLQDMFSRIDKYIRGESKQNAAFYFGHTETVIPILTLLGLFNDSNQLRADNFHENSRRTFRTTSLAPFATNVAFVIRDCGGDPSKDPSGGDRSSDPYGRYTIQLLFKEREILWPACDGSSSCSYARVREYYRQFVSACDFDGMCERRDSKADKHEEL